jgi:hypothetical protein
MKRSTGFPSRRSEGEFKLNSSRAYGNIESDAKKGNSKVNPIFTERPHYGITEPVKGAVKYE